MVTLYTNENNPFALKLLICANLAGKDVTLKIVSLQDKMLEEPKRLPYLKLTDERVLFVSNAAAVHLFPCDEKQCEINEWLEWESLILGPIVMGWILNASKTENQKTILTNYLRKLNEQLSHSSTILGKLTVVDVAIWSLLYPLYKVKNTLQVFSSFTNIVNWIKSLELKEEFQRALVTYKIDGVNCYTTLQQIGAKCFNHQQNIVAQDIPAICPTQSPIDTVPMQEISFAQKAWQKTLKDLPTPRKHSDCVLPIKGEKNILITSALPYVNNVPHLGNIIGCVLSADVFARFCRMCNYNTLFIGGTDEYGTATETKALEENLSCQEICDKYFQIHSDIYKWFSISFDHFGRTSAPEQTTLCQEMFLTLNSNGFMFIEQVEQLYCSSCKRYLADRFVEGGCPHLGCNYEDARGDQCDGCGKLVNAVELKNPRCKICGGTPQKKSSSQFFIDLPKLEPLLLHWMKQSAPGWSNNAQVIGRAWLREGLKPRCITRDLKWGVPVPLDGFRDKVFYVWFDAPLGYMSITKAYTNYWEKWWKPEPQTDVTLYQFMAKDNVPFHAVMFPATLLGANKGYTTVSHIMATEYLNYEDGKFSKSRGVGVFGNDAQDTRISSSVWRFYLLYIRPESQDSSFSWSDLAMKNNSELLNNLGNFVNRALVFLKNNFNCVIPEMKPITEDYIFLALCTREYKNYIACLEKAKLRDGIRCMLAVSRCGNQYMQSTQPWFLLKGSSADKERAATIIGISCNIVCLLAALLHPYMPETSETLLKQLNTSLPILTPDNPEIVQFLPAGHKINEPSPLFTKIEPSRCEELKKLFAGKQYENGKMKPDETTQPVAVVNGNDCRNLIDSTAVKQLEEGVEKQGQLVRKLKQSGKEKSVWQPEVEKLLHLKASLAAATGNSTAPLINKKKKK